MCFKFQVLEVGDEGNSEIKRGQLRAQLRSLPLLNNTELHWASPSIKMNGKLKCLGLQAPNEIRDNGPHDLTNNHLDVWVTLWVH